MKPNDLVVYNKYKQIKTKQTLWKHHKEEQE